MELQASCFFKTFPLHMSPIMITGLDTGHMTPVTVYLSTIHTTRVFNETDLVMRTHVQLAVQRCFDRCYSPVTSHTSFTTNYHVPISRDRHGSLSVGPRQQRHPHPDLVRLFQSVLNAAMNLTYNLAACLRAHQVQGRQAINLGTATTHVFLSFPLPLFPSYLPLLFPLLYPQSLTASSFPVSTLHASHPFLLILSRVRRL
jgi:hypothetical protein